MLKPLLLCLVLTLSSAFSEKTRFDNYTLYKVLPKNVDHIKILQNLYESDRRYEFWNDPLETADFVNVLSSPEHKSDFENILISNNVHFEVSMENIQEAIDKETVKSYTRSNLRSMQWNAYYNLEAIYAWIDDLAAEYSNIVSVIIGGSTFEGRQIKGLKISHGEGRRFRLWRKNRRPIGNNFGVDLNRNWNNNWLVFGSTTDPAADNYAGLGPFSEPETRTLSTYIQSIGDKIDVYLSFHSYGQMLLLPFGNSTEPLANYDDAMKIGRRAIGALSFRYATPYVIGNIAETIYLATGGSVDWVKEKLRVPVVYCYELRDRGATGFLLPPEEILPNSLEVMDSVLEIILQAKRFGVISSGNGVKASFTLIVVAVMAKFW